jgi:hypothetical protein
LSLCSLGNASPLTECVILRCTQRFFLSIDDKVFLSPPFTTGVKIL